MATKGKLLSIVKGLPPKKQTKEELIDEHQNALIKRLQVPLEHAQKGEFTCIAVVGLDREGTIQGTYYVTPESHTWALIGALEGLKARMLGNTTAGVPDEPNDPENPTG